MTDENGRAGTLLLTFVALMVSFREMLSGSPLQLPAPHKSEARTVTDFSSIHHPGLRFNNFTTTMKTFGGSFVLICALVAFSARSLSQISLTAADVDSIFAVGKTLTQYSDTLTTAVDIGVPGPSATSWDFSAFNSHAPTVLSSVIPQTTPYIGEYPGATHALQSIQTVSFSGNPVVVTAYQYLSLGQNLLNPGNMGGGTVSLPPFGSFPGTVQTTNVPAEITYVLPSTLGTSWTSSYARRFTVMLSLVVLSDDTVAHTVSHVVDAFGLMKIGASTQQALRVRNEDRTPDGKQVTYTFLSKHGAVVQLGTCDTTLPGSGVVPVCSISWTAGDGTSDILVPIQLVAFGATYVEEQGCVRVEWSTMSEINNYGFYVQRGRQRDRFFTDIGDSFVPGHGTTIVPQRYAFVDKSPQADARLYRLKQVDLDGTVHYSQSVELSAVTGVKKPVPTEFALEQNFPNPFNPTTEIWYNIAGTGGQGLGASQVRLAVYDLLGREVAVLVNERKEPGSYAVHFDANGLASGIYFYRHTAGSFVETKKLIVLR